MPDCHMAVMTTSCRPGRNGDTVTFHIVTDIPMPQKSSDRRLGLHHFCRIACPLLIVAIALGGCAGQPERIASARPDSQIPLPADYALIGATARSTADSDPHSLSALQSPAARLATEQQMTGGRRYLREADLSTAGQWLTYGINRLACGTAEKLPANNTLTSDPSCR